LVQWKVAEFRHGGDGNGELHATQGLEGFDDRAQAPRCDLFLEFLVEALSA